jgi:PBP1b-binding outer membrane lipoprotein LpoB
MYYGVQTYMRGQKMKIKLLVFLIFSLIIFSSCSVATEKEIQGIEDSQNTEEEKVNNNAIEIEEKVIDNKGHDEILEQVIKDIKVESGVKEDIELSDIKRIQDTYYVVVKVNKPDIVDSY